MAKNTICLWYDGDAEAAARFYAETFPDSTVGAVHRAPGDYPSGKKGDVLIVEFNVAGVSASTAVPRSNITKPSRSRLPLTIKLRPTAIGTPSSAMAAKRAPAAGAKINGAFRGKLRRVC
jgi:uncharacterized glyoxalase superfamily protein PhnB